MNSNWKAKWEEMTTREEEEMKEEDDARLINAAKMMADAANWVTYEQLKLQQQPQWGGSVVGRAYKPRQRWLANERLLNDYFVDNPVFNEVEFRRRYRMRRPIFLRMLDHVQAANPYFKQSYDGVGHPGFSPHQKITCSL